ncbi:MAG: hypothetical protein KAI55_02915 [Candidatus Aenigmarchaeota archaeon]|nr:hypothetical protein [Candidatus Aenigmarchaeota archaeon]
MAIDDGDIDRLKNLVEFDDKESDDKEMFPSVREHKYPPARERISEPIVSTTRQQTGGGDKNTHTFVKVDGHLSIVNDLIEGKRDIKAIATTIALLSRAEKIKTQAVIRLEEELNKMIIKIHDIEEKMTIEGHSFVEPNYESEEIVSATTAVEEPSFSDELERLKKDLETM